MCEKRDQVPKRDLSLFEKHDSEEEEKDRGEKGRREKRKDKGASERMFSVFI